MKEKRKKQFQSSSIGAFIVAICCVTPLLVIAVTTVGFAALAPYLDFILYPLLALMIFLMVVYWRKYKEECRSCEIRESSEKEIIQK